MNVLRCSLCGFMLNKPISNICGCAYCFKCLEDYHQKQLNLLKNKKKNITIKIHCPNHKEYILPSKSQWKINHVINEISNYIYNHQSIHLTANNDSNNINMFQCKCEKIRNNLILNNSAKDIKRKEALAKLEKEWKILFEQSKIVYQNRIKNISPSNSIVINDKNHDEVISNNNNTKSPKTAIKSPIKTIATSIKTVAGIKQKQISSNKTRKYIRSKKYHINKKIQLKTSKPKTLKVKRYIMGHSTKNNRIQNRTEQNNIHLNFQPKPPLLPPPILFNKIQIPPPPPNIKFVAKKLKKNSFNLNKLSTNEYSFDFSNDQISKLYPTPIPPKSKSQVDIPVMIDLTLNESLTASDLDQDINGSVIDIDIE